MNPHPTPDSEQPTWFEKHPILTLIGGIILFIIVIGRINNFFDPGEEAKEVQKKVDATPIVSIYAQSFERGTATTISRTSKTFTYVHAEMVDSGVDSKQVIVKLHVGDFLTAKSLYRETGQVSGKLFQDIYSIYPKVQDIDIHYYADTTDKYGNVSNNLALYYSMDRNLFEKINWQNFEVYKLCDFLKAEPTGSNSCDAKVNIK